MRVTVSQPCSPRGEGAESSINVVRVAASAADGGAGPIDLESRTASPRRSGVRMMGRTFGGARSVIFHDPVKILQDLRKEHKNQNKRRKSVSVTSTSPLLTPSHIGGSLSIPPLVPSPRGGSVSTDCGAGATVVRETVRVAVRIRPMVPRDRTQRQQDVVRVAADGKTVSVTEDMDWPATPPQIPSSPGGRARSMSVFGRGARAYTFDIVFDSRASAADHATQARIHEEIGERLVREAMEGYNACLFAYGQTGSGKTHTVMGHSQRNDDRGLLPRVLEGIFAEAERLSSSELQTTSIKISFIEIYNESIQDLLVPPQKRPQQSLSVRYSPNLGVVIVDLSECVASSLEEALELLNFGMKMRSVAATSMNSRSSRAHTIFSLRLERTSLAGDTRIAQVQIVDLAGREQEKKSGDDRDRLRERAFINKSLFHLSTCISNLAKSSGQKLDWTFRNSKLTLVLAQSLGQNSRTTMIAAISPSAADTEETISTLRFATSVKLIKTEATCNAVNKRDLVSELQSEIQRLKAEMQAAEKNNNYRTLREQVTELEALCDHYRQSFQQEQLISKQLAEERRRALEELGLSVESGSTDVLDKGQGLPYLVNLSEDPFLEGCLMYVLRCGVTTTLGTADDNHIRLKGLGVAEHHCAIQHEEGDRLILRVSCLEDVLASQGSNPESSRCFGVSDAEAAGGGERAAADSQSQQGVGIEYPRTLVNGRRVGSAPAQLRHQDRLILGHALVFRVGVPAAEARPRRGSGSPEIVCEGDNQCQLEQALAEVNEPQCATVLKLCSFSEMLPKEMLGKFMQDVNLAAPLVEEAGLIAQHVRPEEGLEFRLQVSLDVLSATSVGTSGAPEIVIAVMAKSNQDGTAADSFTLPPAALGVGHSPQKRTLRFVWSFEKFRSRLQVMRDVYEEFQARGLEEVRRRLRKEPYDDPWKEIGNGEVQLLLQGLGTADADEERATVGSVTCSTEVGSEDGFYDGGGNSLRARRNFVAARLGRYVDEASCGASSADESGECDAEVNRWEGAEWYTLGRKRSKNIVGAGGRAQQGVAPATYQAAANYSAEASAQRGAALLTPLLRTKTVTQEWGVHVTNLQKWEERIDAKQDLMQRIWEDVRHLQELEPSTHSRRSSGLSASSERSLQSSPTAQFKEVRFSEVPPSSK